MNGASEHGEWDCDGDYIDGEWEECSHIVDVEESVQEEVVGHVAQEGQPGQVNICTQLLAIPSHFIPCHAMRANSQS